MTAAAEKYRSRMLNPFIFWWAMLLKLPTAVFWRLRVKELNEEKCVVTIPYGWRSQNPFKSIYFAAMAGAGELSTGALCQMAMAGKGQFSMLVVDFRAEYHKKAHQKITFTCGQGKEISSLLDGMSMGETGKITTVSEGKNPQNETVAKFFVTWSFKRKS